MRRWPLVIIAIFPAAFALAPASGAAAETGCSGVIARYRAVQENDVASGNVNKAIYAQIKREIEAAEGICSAGQDNKATQMIRASQARHGYSTSL